VGLYQYIFLCRASRNGRDVSHVPVATSTKTTVSCELPLYGVLGSSRQASEDGTMLVVERDAPPGKWVTMVKTLCRISCP
jgi:hypothetical protein